MREFVVNERIKSLVPFLFFAISCISKFLNSFGIPREVSYAIYLMMFACFFIINIRKLLFFDFAYYLIVIPVVIWGVLKFGVYINSYTNKLAILINFFPAYFFFRFCDTENFLKGFKAATYVNVVYLLFSYMTTVRFQEIYSMDYAYSAAVPLCAMLYYYISDKKLWKLILVAILFFTITISGNRGAMVFPLICGLYYIYTDAQFNSSKKRALYIGIILAIIFIIIVWLFSSQIIRYLEQYSGMSRNISKLVNGDFFSSATRERLYAQCAVLIKSNPYGTGPLSSRMLIDGFIYPHSLLYELQIDYGQYFGILLFALIIYITVKNLFIYRKSNLRIYVAIASILGVGSLMISSSFYYETYVPATLAFFVNSKITFGRKSSRNTHEFMEKS